MVSELMERDYVAKVGGLIQLSRSLGFRFGTKGAYFHTSRYILGLAPASV